jgi:FkbM family methyltransferase
MASLVPRIVRKLKFLLGSQQEKSAWHRLALSCRLCSGVKIEVANRAEWTIYNDIFVEQEYDKAIRHLLSRLPGCSGGHPPERPLQVLDLGANVGLFSLRLLHLLHLQRAEASRHEVNAAHAVNAFLVEGNPRTYRVLRRRMKGQPKHLTQGSQFRMVHGLVGERHGTALIQDSAFHVMNRVMNVQSGGGAGGVSIPFIDLESPMHLGRFGPIDLLKCDIEGSELALVQNYPDLLKRVRCAVFEFHSACAVRQCVALLEQCGLSGAEPRQTGASTWQGYFYRQEGIGAGSEEAEMEAQRP